MGEKITVTRWKHPGADMDLILEGVPNQNQEWAKEHFEIAPDLLEAQTEQMDREEFEELPEFDG